MNLQLPGKKERLEAIGAIRGLPEAFQRAFDPMEDFDSLPVPKPGDWLAEHHESGQTFEDFTGSVVNRPDKIRNKIFLQPLGEFSTADSPSIEKLTEYASSFFAIEVKALPPLLLSTNTFTSRLNPFTGNRQILTGDILSFLRKILPNDAFCILAITMEDLYPDPSWNFVFGQASLLGRVGVYSFARYDPLFYSEKKANNYQKILFWRSCKVLAHETAHMFGLTHCIFFKCVMNGSNHLKESDARPLHLCPVCLRKLHFSISFDIINRYNRLLSFYQKAGFDQEAQWVRHRVKKIYGEDQVNRL